MKVFWMVTVALSLAPVGTTASRADAHTDHIMMLLSPKTRVEQRCNARAMGDVRREHKNLHPDEMVSYAFADANIVGSHIDAPGAAIKSGETWYRMSYTCTTSPDGLNIVSFAYRMGELVKRQDWDDHYLHP